MQIKHYHEHIYYKLILNINYTLTRKTAYEVNLVLKKANNLVKIINFNSKQSAHLSKLIKELKNWHKLLLLARDFLYEITQLNVKQSLLVKINAIIKTNAFPKISLESLNIYDKTIKQTFKSCVK